MNTSTNSPVYSGAAPWSQPRSPARNRPCSRACTQTNTDTPPHTGMETDTKTALRRARCPLGFSEMQIAILSLLKGRPPLIAYWQIAEAITLTYGFRQQKAQYAALWSDWALADFSSAVGLLQAGLKAIAMRFLLIPVPTSCRQILRNRAWRRLWSRTRLRTKRAHHLFLQKRQTEKIFLSFLEKKIQGTSFSNWNL